MAKASISSYVPPAEMMPFHVIVKFPMGKNEGLMSHLFVLSEDYGSALNRVVTILSDKGIDASPAQITCKAATYEGAGVYSM